MNTIRVVAPPREGLCSTRRIQESINTLKEEIKKEEEVSTVHKGTCSSLDKQIKKQIATRSVNFPKKQKLFSELTPLEVSSSEFNIHKAPKTTHHQKDSIPKLLDFHSVFKGESKPFILSDFEEDFPWPPSSPSEPSFRYSVSRISQDIKKLTN